MKNKKPDLNAEEYKEKTAYYIKNIDEAINKVVNSGLSIKQIKLIMRANPRLTKEQRELCIQEVKKKRGLENE